MSQHKNENTVRTTMTKSKHLMSCDILFCDMFYIFGIISSSRIGVATLCMFFMLFRLEGLFWESIWDTFVKTIVSMEKSRPFDFLIILQRFCLFLKLPVVPESKKKVKTMSANGCANLHYENMRLDKFLSLGAFLEGQFSTAFLYYFV